MYCDAVLMNGDRKLESFARELGFGKIYFEEDFKEIGLIVSKDVVSNRQLVEKGKIKILVNPHVNSLRDNLHFRSSGINQVICKLCNKNKVSIGFSLDSVMDGVLLGRMKQNIILCRKYKVKIRFFTFAKDKYGLRGKEDLLGFLRSIGLSGREAKEALSC